MRIGQGYDVHAFGVGDRLILGGVEIPFDRSFVAHRRQAACSCIDRLSSWRSRPG